MNEASGTAPRKVDTTQPLVDHLVVLAESLADGVRWCKATLGITPGPGGSHPLMGTHNRLFDISSDAFPGCFCEIIAIDPNAAPTRVNGMRWFDMDDQALREKIREHGPQLIHVVARVPDLAQAVQTMAGLNIDCGERLQVSRETPRGLLQWQITVRADGRRMFHGALPTLIQWGDHHPVNSMAPSGVKLLDFQARHGDPVRLNEAYASLGLAQLRAEAGEPRLLARLETPLGVVELSS